MSNGGRSYAIHENRAALDLIGPDDIEALTARATGATFYRDGLTETQLAANRRIVGISDVTCRAAVDNPRQLLATGMCDGRLAGFVIATVHADDDRELDWLMVDPEHHGSGLAAALMEAGMAWLGADRPMWLNVIAYNERAIRFYQRFGFAIDPEAATTHAIPHSIMRRGT
jgi:ribosomal protein S18 acetylase RimI-like enzyme